jgi:hypothetical protein
MHLLQRRTRLPETTRTALGLDGAGPVLAVAELTNGWAAATRDGLHAELDGRTLRHPWTDVDGARLDPEARELSVTWVDGSAPTVLPLADGAAALPRTVHERVQSSVVHHEAVRVGGEAVRVVLRRAADGALFTQVIGSGRVDLTDPGVASEVDAAEARVREAAGL